MRSSLRILFALALGAAFVGTMSWVDQERDRLFDEGWTFWRLVATWLAAGPLFVLSGCATTSLSRMDFAARLGAPATTIPVTSHFRPVGLVLMVAVFSVMFFLNFATINMRPFLWPWMIATGVALVLPPLLPPRRVGVAWPQRESLAVEWEDGSAFRVPFRSIDSAEQLLDPSEFPFERFGHGTWRPLVMAKADERRLQQLISGRGEGPGSGQDGTRHG